MAYQSGESLARHSAERSLAVTKVNSRETDGLEGFLRVMENLLWAILKRKAETPAVRDSSAAIGDLPRIMFDSNAGGEGKT